jgi:hypothetical protein
MGASVACTRETPQSERRLSTRLSRLPVIALQLIIGSFVWVWRPRRDFRRDVQRGSRSEGVQDLTEMSFATAVAPGADQAVEPAN